MFSSLISSPSGQHIGILAISIYGGKMNVKKCPKIFQMSEKYWGCLDKMSEVNFSPAETLYPILPLAVMIYFTVIYPFL